MTTVDSWPKTLPMPSVGSWNSTTETHLLINSGKYVLIIVSPQKISISFVSSFENIIRLWLENNYVFPKCFSWNSNLIEIYSIGSEKLLFRERNKKLLLHLAKSAGTLVWMHYWDTIKEAFQIWIEQFSISNNLKTNPWRSFV